MICHLGWPVGGGCPSHRKRGISASFRPKAEFRNRRKSVFKFHQMPSTVARLQIDIVCITLPSSEIRQLPQVLNSSAIDGGQPRTFVLELVD